MKTIIYLSGRRSRRLELCGYRDELRKLGYIVYARWLDGKMPAESTGSIDPPSASETFPKFAQEAYVDVTNADWIINFTDPPRSHRASGGRHVEFGMALRTCRRVTVIGPRETVFHWLQVVEWFPTWGSFRAAVAPK